jgi:hypothetical protein
MLPKTSWRNSRNVRAALFLIVLSSRLAGQQNSAEGIRARLTAAGEKLVVFETNDWLYDRWPSWIVGRDGPYEGYRATLEPLQLANFPAANLVTLLADPNPKVRMLAMALLFAKDEPKLLPHLLPLVGDTAPALPRQRLESR